MCADPDQAWCFPLDDWDDDHVADGYSNSTAPRRRRRPRGRLARGRLGTAWLELVWVLPNRLRPAALALGRIHGNTRCSISLAVNCCRRLTSRWPIDACDDDRAPARYRGETTTRATASGPPRSSGSLLGVSFSICFLTGLYSHFAQHPPSWFTLPASPAGLYRVTQGVHVITGIASIPLLLAKLWSVFPKLFRWPPLTSVAHALERISLVPLIAGAIFQLWSGVANIDLWYPLPFFFPAAHYWVAWITIGALDRAHRRQADHHARGAPASATRSAGDPSANAGGSSALVGGGAHCWR